MPYKFIFLLILFLQTQLLGCSIDSSGKVNKDIVNKNDGAINSVCVLPLYGKTSGIGYGPDAEGVANSTNRYLLSPYIVSSGENILSGIVEGNRRAISLPILISWGDNYGVDRLLLLKVGYKPKLLYRQSIWSGYPIIMAKSTEQKVQGILDELVSATVNQDGLKSIYKTESSIAVEYDREDIALLKLCRSNGQTH